MLDLAVQSWGTGPKRALLLHGLSSNAAGWWRVAPALVELGYAVTAPDLRGHGGSPASDGYTLAEYSSDIRGLGDGWDLVLGHSLGGAVALILASESPGFCSRLVLEDPAIAIPDPDLALEPLLGSYQPPIASDQVAQRNPTWHPEDCRFKVQALIESRPAMVEQTILQNRPWNLVAEVIRLEIPTLLIGADILPVIPEAFGFSLAQSNPNVEFVKVPGSSHSIHRDEFIQLMELIASFLAD